MEKYKKTQKIKEEILIAMFDTGLIVGFFIFCYLGWHICVSLECKNIFNGLFLGVIK